MPYSIQKENPENSTEKKGDPTIEEMEKEETVEDTEEASGIEEETREDTKEKEKAMEEDQVEAEVAATKREAADPETIPEVPAHTADDSAFKI